MKIFIVGFPSHYEQKDLNSLFAKYGTVKSSKVIIDFDTGQSKCFGFVDMPHEEEAKKAIASLNDTMIEDRKLSVMEARENKK